MDSPMNKCNYCNQADPEKLNTVCIFLSPASIHLCEGSDCFVRYIQDCTKAISNYFKAEARMEGADPWRES